MTAAARHYLAIDMGASSGRAVLGTLRGGRLELRDIHRFQNGPVEMGGTLYWDFPRLWSETREALRRCAGCGVGRLDGIGVDTWGVDFGLLGADGRLNGNPLCYRDRITEGSVKIISAALSPERLYARTGMAAGRVGTLSQLVGLRRESRGARLREASTLLTMPDLFRYFLCGHKAVERTMAGSTLLTDVRTGRWCRTLLRALHLPERLLPPIVSSPQVVGKLDAALAAAAGLNRAPVVAVAGHDTLSAAAAAPYDDASTVFLSSGTWSVVGVLLAQPLTTVDALRRGFVNELGVEGVLLAKNLIGLYLFENLKRARAQKGAVLSYSAMTRAAAAAPPFACRLDVSAPEFFVTEDPMESVRTYLERTRQKPLTTPAAVARAILEGLAWSFRDAIRDLSALTGREFRRIGMVGGGTRNRLLCRLVADATGLEVLAGPAEATAAGNIALQAMATGAVRGVAGVRELVRKSFPTRRYRPRLAEAWNEAERDKPEPER